MCGTGVCFRGRNHCSVPTASGLFASSVFADAAYQLIETVYDYKFAMFRVVYHVRGVFIANFTAMQR